MKLVEAPILRFPNLMKYVFKVDFAKIKIILDLKPPVNPKQVRVLLGHTEYYRKL